MPKKEDLTNQVFGLIKCISPAQSKSGKTYWNCKCIKCGAEKIIQTSHLKDGRTKTCGCGCKYINTDDTFKQNTKEKICEICGQPFMTTSANRKYCFNCSPDIKSCSDAERISTFRKAMKTEAVKRKGGKCERCGYDNCLNALHFHHPDPSNKDFGLSQNGILKSWAEYWQEAQKCVLLCANCHAEIHSQS